MLPTREQFEQFGTWTVGGRFDPILVCETWINVGAVRVAFLPAPTLQYRVSATMWADL